MSLFPKSPEVYLTDIPRGKNSKVFVVDPVNGSDSNTGEKFEFPLLTISAALAKCTGDRHDTVLVIGGDTAVLETAAVNWNKDYTHLIGLCAPTHVSQRARIVCNATDLSPFFTLSAKGCLIRNVIFWQGQDDVHSLVCVSVTGPRNVFDNVHFAGGGHATQAIDGGASLLLNGGSENRFIHCTIGIDTISDGTGMAGLVVAATGGAARNLFEHCTFRMYAGHAGAIFVELLGNSGLDRDLTFKDCIFLNLSSTAMTQAFAVAAGFDPANKRVLLKDCALIGATDWDGNDRGILYLNNGTITGGGNAGLFAASAAA